MSASESVSVPRAEIEELRKRYKIGGERSWALSAILARISDDEMARIARSLSIEDNKRLEAAVLSYVPDIAAAESA